MARRARSSRSLFIATGMASDAEPAMRRRAPLGRHPMTHHFFKEDP